MTDCRKIAAEGMVLLKNENHTLPLEPGKIALFGAGAVDTVTCGTGSGYIVAPYIVNVEKGLRNAGFIVTSGAYLKRFAAADKKANKKDKTLSWLDKRFSGEKILIDEPPIAPDELKNSQAAETCIYVVRRNTGENHDRKAVKGDYFLSDNETANLKLLAKSFQQIIVVLNTCVVDANFAVDISEIGAVVLMGPAGNESGNALADVLTGKVNPSGKLTDTWACEYSDYPASPTFSLNDGDSHQETYNEDIFVGYRYFDTFKIRPLFPFGFGLSYTAFEIDVKNVNADWNRVSITIEIKNTGALSGKEVVQVYVSAPEGRLPKPYQELKGFAKSNLLQPGESQTVTVLMPTESLASYDTDKAAFVMEAGDYIVRVGNSSRDTKIAAIIRLDDETSIRTVTNKCKPDREITSPIPPKRSPENVTAIVLELSSKDCIVINGTREKQEDPGFSHSNPSSTLLDVKAGKVPMEDFVASLDAEVLFRIVTGSGYETKYSVPIRMKTVVKNPKAPGSSGSTTGLFTSSLGIPQANLSDGPAGLHMLGCGVTCFPCGIVLAQSWDSEIVRLMGRDLGRELKFYHHRVSLGPGMNIHRDPLCGRNFEYFSEDPLLTGKIAVAVTTGVQETPGSCVSIKHFCCNNQEEDRTTGNSTVSERALREIYLRGFEICVREAKPETVMSSYNCLNGIHTSSNYELLTGILREEWGFEGLVMTDWGSQSDKALDFAAGNDLIMGGYRTKKLMAALNGTEPEFTADGFIKEETFNVYGGFFKEHSQSWNSFLPAADGTDTVSVTVPKGTKPSDKIKEYVNDGIAEIEDTANGDKLIRYRGSKRGAYLQINDVRKCAMRVLRFLMETL
jgi:beta-glucosidase